MNIKPARGMQLLASHKIPPRSFIQIVAALAVGIVVKLYGCVSVISRRLTKPLNTSLSIGRYMKSTV